MPAQDKGKEIYLGDAVFVSFDGYHIWLRTQTLHNDQIIALEPTVLDNFMEYADKTKKLRIAFEAGDKETFDRINDEIS